MSRRYLIAAAHGDLKQDGAPDHQDQDLAGNSSPCVVNIQDFTGCFLYSVESQMTIGYGTSYPSQECPEAIFVLCMQSILGLIIQVRSHCRAPARVGSLSHVRARRAGIGGESGPRSAAPLPVSGQKEVW